MLNFISIAMAADYPLLQPAPIPMWYYSLWLILPILFIAKIIFFTRAYKEKNGLSIGGLSFLLFYDIVGVIMGLIGISLFWFMLLLPVAVVLLLITIVFVTIKKQISANLPLLALELLFLVFALFMTFYVGFRM